MPFKESTVMSQKELFIKEVLAAEKPFSHICEAYGISRPTGYLLVKRYKNEGLNGLDERSRAPHASPSRTKRSIEEMILSIRVQHPSWGARKIKAYLERKGSKDLPAASTITQILKRYGHISIEESLKRRALIRFEREQPNDLWQMDFKGKFKLSNEERCFPLTVLDDHSRFSLCIKACKNEQPLPVKKALTQVFEQYGMPLQINVDNGHPWGNSKLYPYTTLTVWLMRLGIVISHSRPKHPQTNGKDERFHRTLKADVISRQSINNFTHAQRLFDTWRDVYNYDRPHEALDMKVPADRYEPSKRILPHSLSPIEYSDDAIIRKVRGNGYISYKNREYLVGEAFLNNDIEIKPHELGGRFTIYFGKNKIYTYDIA